MTLEKLLKQLWTHYQKNILKRDVRVSVDALIERQALQKIFGLLMSSLESHKVDPRLPRNNN